MKNSTLVLVTKMKSKALCFSLLLVVLLNANLKAVTYSYLLYISEGVAHTSGGFSGNGIGDLTIHGKFRLNIDYGMGQATLEDVDISFNEPYSGLPLNFDWSDFFGMINGTAISLYIPQQPPLVVDHYLEGTFDGAFAYLQGTVWDVGIYDGYQYDCEITAVVIESCDYLVAGDTNDDCKVELRDFAELAFDWQIGYDPNDLTEMAANWLLDCNVTPGDPACVPK